MVSKQDTLISIINKFLLSFIDTADDDACNIYHQESFSMLALLGLMEYNEVYGTRRIEKCKLTKLYDTAIKKLQKERKKKEIKSNSQQQQHRKKNNNDKKINNQSNYDIVRRNRFDCLHHYPFQDNGTNDYDERTRDTASDINFLRTSNHGQNRFAVKAFNDYKTGVYGMLVSDISNGLKSLGFQIEHGLIDAINKSGNNIHAIASSKIGAPAEPYIDLDTWLSLVKKYASNYTSCMKYKSNTTSNAVDSYNDDEDTDIDQDSDGNDVHQPAPLLTNHRYCSSDFKEIATNFLYGPLGNEVPHDVYEKYTNNDFKRKYESKQAAIKYSSSNNKNCNVNDIDDADDDNIERREAEYLLGLNKAGQYETNAFAFADKYSTINSCNIDSFLKSNKVTAAANAAPKPSKASVEADGWMYIKNGVMIDYTLHDRDFNRMKTMMNDNQIADEWNTASTTDNDEHLHNANVNKMTSMIPSSSSSASSTSSVPTPIVTRPDVTSPMSILSPTASSTSVSPAHNTSYTVLNRSAHSPASAINARMKSFGLDETEARSNFDDDSSFDVGSK